jgi:hypothetical protein
MSFRTVFRRQISPWPFSGVVIIRFARNYNQKRLAILIFGHHFPCMAAKAQHDPQYLTFPLLLRNMREEAGMTQRQLGIKMRKPQSWIHNCEVANRRVDVTEFIRWAKACGVDQAEAFKQVLATQ